MKLNKLLKNNTFLINSSACLVLLLAVCYLGLNSPIKETYSAEQYSLVGSFKWNDELTEMNLVYLDIAYPLSFKDDAGNSYTTFKILGSGLSNTTYELYYDSTLVTETGVLLDSRLIFTSESSKIIHLDGSNNDVDSQFYEWFNKNTTPNNRCYYNSGSKTYVWTNDFNTGILYSEFTTQETCEAENKKSVTITYSVDGKTDDVTVKVGDSVTLRNAVKDGYSFKGWYTEPTGGERKGTFGESFSPEGNITLYAQFEAFAINVDFKNYKVEGNYIFANVGTTPDEFEANIEVSETGVSFIYSPSTPSLLHTGLGFEISLEDGRKNNYIFVVLGDVNKNGKIDSQDYAEIYNHFTEIKLLSGIEAMAADYSENGTIDSQDYVEIYNYFKSIE